MCTATRALMFGQLSDQLAQRKAERQTTLASAVTAPRGQRGGGSGVRPRDSWTGGRLLGLGTSEQLLGGQADVLK